MSQSSFRSELCIVWKGKGGENEVENRFKL